MKTFSMSRTTMSIFLTLFIACHSIWAQQGPKGPWLQYKNNETAGFSTQKLEAAKAQFKKMRSSSLMVVHQGKVVAAWGDVSRRFLAHSIRKSLMSAMYGIYEEKGRIDLNKTLQALGIDDLQGLSDQEKQATVQNLITARSGIYHPAAYEPKSMKRNRPQRGSAQPGERFFYNNWDFNTLLTILEQEADLKFFEAIQKDISDPLGMEDLRPEDMNYRLEKESSQHPAYLFKISTRDLARFGQLYLNKGSWNGRQLVPADWVSTSTKAFSTDLGGFSNRGGYGYLWWVDAKTYSEPTYFASGSGGHRLYIFPKSELVIVHRVNSYLNMGVREADLKALIQGLLDAKTAKAKPNPELVPLAIKSSGQPRVKQAKKQLKQYTGTYEHPFFKEISVYLAGNQLRMKGEILGNFRVYPGSKKDEFWVEDLPELPLIFSLADEQNPKGKATTEVNERGIPTRVIMYY